MQKTVKDLDTNTVTSARRYLYDGWNLVAELDAAGSAMQRSYTWGLDAAGSLSATAGIGALVRAHDHAGAGNDYYPSYDGNGNVSSLTRGDGTLVAIYEYSPFGELLRGERRDSNDAFVASNPWKFSTKFTDDETGLVYYGLRYYSPVLGRFINRDPIEERGGLNLYEFAGNAPVRQWDVLGLGAVW